MYSIPTKCFSVPSSVAIIVIISIAVIVIIAIIIIALVLAVFVVIYGKEGVYVGGNKMFHANLGIICFRLVI